MIDLVAVIFYIFSLSLSHSSTLSSFSTAPNVTDFRVNETGSTNTTAYLTWTLQPENILVAKYLVITP